MGLSVPGELAQLYELYQQEIHASTYTESNEVYSAYRLPPISARYVYLLLLRKFCLKIKIFVIIFCYYDKNTE